MPNANDVENIHRDLTRLFEEENDPISPPGVKNADLLESACSRPHTALGDTEKYPSLVWKLAALTQSITKNHPFHNGNKRAALATLLTTLHRNRLCLKPSIDDDTVFNFIVSVTADEFPTKNHGLPPDEVVKKIAWWIKDNTETVRNNVGSIRVNDFVDRCEHAGMIAKKNNNGIVIMNPHAAKIGKQRSINLSGATRQLNGKTAAAFVRKLGLNAQNSGMDSNEFYDGPGVERKVIHRFIVALRRLAKT